MKKGILILVFIIIGAFVFAGGTTEGTGATPTGRTQVNWWTHWSGTMADPLKEFIEEFNASQDKYQVNYIYQGTTLDVIGKLQSTGKKDLPAMFTGATECVGYFADADYVVPIQKFINQDNWDVSDLFPISRMGYSNRNGELVGYPTCNSFAGIYVNLDIFKAAGIDPYTSLNTIEDIYDTCKKIVDGGFAKTGIGFHSDAYWIAMVLSTQGVPAFDNNDGWSGPVTRSVYNEEPTKSALHTLLNTLQNLYKDGYAIPYGTDVNVELIPRFAAGEFPILQCTTGFYNKIMLAGANFNIDLLPLFGCDDKRAYQGIPAAGCGSFIVDNGNKESQQGAYEFIKYMAKPENNARFAMATGYLPQTQKAVDTPVYQEYLRTTFPAAANALKTQANSDGSIRNPLAPIGNEHKEANAILITTITNDPNYNVNKAIDEATVRLTEAVELFNLSN